MSNSAKRVNGFGADARSGSNERESCETQELAERSNLKLAGRSVRRVFFTSIPACAETNQRKARWVILWWREKKRMCKTFGFESGFIWSVRKKQVAAA